MATDLKKFAEQLVGLTVLEVNELGTILKDTYGIEPAAAAVSVAAPAGGDAAPAEDAKSEVTKLFQESWERENGFFFAEDLPPIVNYAQDILRSK